MKCYYLKYKLKSKGVHQILHFEEVSEARIRSTNPNAIEQLSLWDIGLVSPNPSNINNCERYITSNYLKDKSKIGDGVAKYQLKKFIEKI